MPSFRTAAALAGLGLLAACSNSMSPSTGRVDQPLQGARPPASSDDARAMQTQAPMRNSDNKSIESRTGLNADPNNPNGAARSSVDVKGN
jgi:hypothetical protein